LYKVDVDKTRSSGGVTGSLVVIVANALYKERNPCMAKEAGATSKEETEQGPKPCLKGISAGTRPQADRRRLDEKLSKHELSSERKAVHKQQRIPRR